MFRFVEETHSYWLGRERLPGVTSIIGPCYDYSSIPADVLQKAGAYGTAVHLATKLYLDNDLDETTLDPALIAPLEAFKRWWDDNKLGYSFVVERPMYHPRLKYAGTPDLILDGYAIVDFKTRPANKLTDAIQLAAYEKLWLNHVDHASGPYRHLVLELHQDGTYKEVPVKTNDSWNRFRYLLDFYRMGETIQKWRKNK